MTGKRIPQGGLIDRSEPRRFTFDGKHYDGFAGDTLASALLGNGVSVLGRSFKYHRPRGAWGAWVDDPNAIMDVSLQDQHFPNCAAATTPLENQMEARAVNAWPSAQFDIKGGLDLFHRWLGAGFYYKTFMWPDWHLFEPMIRRMAGLGTVNPQVLEEYLSDQINAQCDVLVIGGGPSGLTTALIAAEAGQDVVLVDDHDTFGGSAYQLSEIEGHAAQDWVQAQLKSLKNAGARLLPSTTAFGVYDHGLVAMAQSTGFGHAPRLWRMRPGRTVLATGALDRPLTFAGNDRPGVMSLIGAAEYLARYGVLVGENICVLSNNSMAATAIGALERAGARITQLDPTSGTLEAFGRNRLAGVSVGGQKHAADIVLASGGMTPLIHLWRHAGGKLEWNEAKQAFLPGAAPSRMSAVGAANGTFDLDTALIEAEANAKGSPYPVGNSTYQVTALWPDAKATGRQWIDFQHDVTLKDVAQAASENYVSVEHLKRYTTLGMASDQGKTSNMAGLAAMAAIQRRPIPEVGTTTFRPPFVPVPLALYRGAHRGTHYRPLQRLPLENAHRAAGAAFGEYGGWLRPSWYGGTAGKAHVDLEITMSRSTVGLFDASPLGKIDVMGPDAETFLNFIYYNTVSTLKPGAIRYGFMLTEAGVVYDDGVLTRVGPDHFIVSCSSSHVAGVTQLLETWRQDGNDPDRVFIHNATAQWATLTVTGPKARDVLEDCSLGVDLSATAFPHMQMRMGRFEGADVRLSRVSFTGDLSYEIAIQSSRAQPLWDTLAHAAQSHGGGPIGLEALSVMRAEKGYIIIGRDTDGLTMPHDLGFGAPRLKKKAAFVGDRSLHQPMANDLNRRQFVGLSVAAGADALPTGAHVLDGSDASKSIGIVTSSYNSPTLGQPIALGLVEGGAERHGETIEVFHLGSRRSATITSPCFYDPLGEKLNA